MPASPTPPARPDSVRARKKKEIMSVQRFLPIAEIREDTVLLKNGGFRAVLAVGSLNFSLKSEEEQEAILRSYQGFLNTLEFPLQIVVRSMPLNIDSYLEDMRQIASRQQNPLLRENTLEYCSFIERLIVVANIMQKRFYAVVPLDLPGVEKMTFFQKFLQWMSPGDSREKARQRRQRFQQMSKQLDNRVSLVQSGLESIGVTVRRLDTGQLIELYYSIYNPRTSQTQRVVDFSALGFHNEVL